MDSREILKTIMQMSEKHSHEMLSAGGKIPDSWIKDQEAQLMKMISQMSPAITEEIVKGLGFQVRKCLSELIIKKFVDGVSADVQMKILKQFDGEPQ